MKYRQLDSIVFLDPGHQIVALRTLRAEEEYLKDHFPRFPVMPGVMMLEALNQAAMWLVRATDEFSHPLALLREVRGVKFGDFLAPNETLEINAKLIKTNGNLYTLKASAAKDSKTTVSARLIFETTNIETDRDPLAGESCRRQVQEQFETLFGSHIPTSAPP